MYNSLVYQWLSLTLVNTVYSIFSIRTLIHNFTQHRHLHFMHYITYAILLQLGNYTELSMYCHAYLKLQILSKLLIFTSLSFQKLGQYFDTLLILKHFLPSMLLFSLLPSSLTYFFILS